MEIFWMIIFSPHTKFTMQRLADHVANGAYFYFNFEYDSSKKSIDSLLEKMTDRYELGISPRQRSYRLEKGHPICTMIVQRDVFKEDKWFIYCLFTTPTSRDFNTFNGIESNKLAKESERLKIEKLKEKYKGFKWDLDSISAEKTLIADYFKDNEPKQFVLKNPIAVKPTALVTMELFRDTHKTYKQLILGDEKDYKDRVRAYTWTWRYTKQSIEKIKNKFTDAINKLASQKNSSLAEKNRADIKNLFLMVETWSVFKASRSQAGQIIHFAKRFLAYRSKKQKSWMQMEITPPHLTYLPRLATYADTIYEYTYRRNLFDSHGVEVPLKLIKDYYDGGYYNIPIQAYVAKELEMRENGKAIAQKADELYLQVLEDE